MRSESFHHPHNRRQNSQQHHADATNIAHSAIAFRSRRVVIAVRRRRRTVVVVVVVATTTGWSRWRVVVAAVNRSWWRRWRLVAHVRTVAHTATEAVATISQEALNPIAIAKVGML